MFACYVLRLRHIFLDGSTFRIIKNAMRNFNDNNVKAKTQNKKQKTKNNEMCSRMEMK